MMDKVELARALGWSRSRLDRAVSGDPGFPVVSRGGRHVQWSFDLAAVREYLARAPRGGREKQEKPKPSAGLDKTELARAIGWSRPRLDRWIEQHEDFPVLKRGTQGGGWLFDLEVVETYLGIGGAPANARTFAARSLSNHQPASTDELSR